MGMSLLGLMKVGRTYIKICYDTKMIIIITLSIIGSQSTQKVQEEVKIGKLIKTLNSKYSQILSI